MVTNQRPSRSARLRALAARIARLVRHAHSAGVPF